MWCLQEMSSAAHDRMPQDRPTSSSAKMISRSSIGSGNGNSNKINSTVNCSGMNIQPRYGVRVQDEVVAMRSPLGFFGGFSETSHWSQNLRRHRTQALGLGFYPRSRWGCNDSSSERFPNTSLIATSFVARRTPTLCTPSEAAATATQRGDGSHPGCHRCE